MPLPNPSSETRENVRPRGRPAKDPARARRNLAEVRGYLKSRLERLRLSTRTSSGRTSSRSSSWRSPEAAATASRRSRLGGRNTATCTATGCRICSSTTRRTATAPTADNVGGYYPATLYSTSGLRSQAEKVAWYGEVVDSSSHSGSTHTDMGSGHHPSAGWTYAAYMHNLKYQFGTSGSMSTYSGGTSLVTNSDWYDVETHFSSGTTWESYQWLGGPGAG